MQPPHRDEAGGRTDDRLVFSPSACQCRLAWHAVSDLQGIDRKCTYIHIVAPDMGDHHVQHMGKDAV